KVLIADPKNPNVIPGLAESLEKADLLLVSMRRRAMPEKDLEAVRKFLASGKSVIGIRTASHAFDAKGMLPEGHAVWPKFDPEVLGGNYTGHHGTGTKTPVQVIDGAAKHPILSGVQMPFTAHGSLYKVSPLGKSTTLLLTGSIPNQPSEPVAWINAYGKSRVFYTSLGHPDDFQDPQFRRLLSNALLWSLDRAIPAP